jgi:hypothetical protein
MSQKTYNLVVFTLGATLALCVLSIAVLAGLDKAIPGILENVTVGCLTGLAGIVTRPPQDEQRVTVVNTPNDPVPVEAGHADTNLIIGVCLLLLTAALLATVCGLI